MRSSCNPLKGALHAGALCEIAREGISSIYVFTSHERQILGRVLLQRTFRFFEIVDKDIEFADFKGGEDSLSTTALSSSDGIVKSAIRIIQLVFACITLYRSRGHQLEVYGYAAFGLTGARYAVMSLVNLIANLLTPHYLTLYMVCNPGMEEAERFGCKFESVVADISKETVNDVPRTMSKRIDFPDELGCNLSIRGTILHHRRSHQVQFCK